jgi:hypothetical protein
MKLDRAAEVLKEIIKVHTRRHRVDEDQGGVIEY